MLLFKKIHQLSLLTTISILGSLFVANFALADIPENPEAGNLIVEFSSTPLFSENDFLPGDTTVGSVVVYNNSGQEKPVVVEAINVLNTSLEAGGKFGDGLNLIITEDSGVECFNGTLTEFFGKGEFRLSESDLANGSEITYNFTVIFIDNSDNDYQDKNLGFDILIGFQGEESVSDGASGGSGSLPAGMILKDVVIYNLTENSAKFSWFTSYKATSRIIYCKASENCVLDLNDNVGNSPLYGYNYTTAELHTPASVNGVQYRGDGINEIGVTGLEANTTYYYRAISHASPATISRNYSLTTLAIGDRVIDKVIYPLQGQEDGKNKVANFEENKNFANPVNSVNPDKIENRENKEVKNENVEEIVLGVIAENEEGEKEFEVINSGENESKIQSNFESSYNQVLFAILILLLAAIVLVGYIYRFRIRKKRYLGEKVEVEEVA